MYRVFFALVLAVSITAINVDAQYPYCGVCQAPLVPSGEGQGRGALIPPTQMKLSMGHLVLEVLVMGVEGIHSRWKVSAPLRG
jgi:hypothetical protein